MKGKIEPNENKWNGKKANTQRKTKIIILFEIGQWNDKPLSIDQDKKKRDELIQGQRHDITGFYNNKCNVINNFMPVNFINLGKMDNF